MPDPLGFILVEEHDVFSVGQALELGLSYEFLRSQLAARRWKLACYGILVAHN